MTRFARHSFARHSFARHLLPSPLLIETQQWSIDLVIHLLLHTLLNPLGTWIVTLTTYFLTSKPKWLRFSTFVTICWILRYYNRRSRVARARASPPPKRSRNVIVTGGSHGLGLEIAIQLASKSTPYKIFILDVERPNSLYNEQIQFIKCDMSSEKSVDAAYSEIVADGGIIDALICNAGVRQSQTTTTMSMDHIHDIFEVNYFSHLRLLKLVVDGHLKGPSENTLHLLAISSVLGFVSPKALAVYSATKSALLNLLTSLRYELPSSVLVSTFIPGQLTSRMFEDVKVDHSFLAPLIDHRKLAGRVIEVLDEGVEGYFAYPLYGRLLPLLQVLPYSWNGWLRGFSGMDEAQ